MRHGNNPRRQRSRGGGGRRNNHGQGGGKSRTQVYDSNGPDVRIRGTAHQVAEKYVALARDAASIGDTMMEQSYLQHAEHYQRIISSWGESKQDKPRTEAAVPQDSSTQPNEAKAADCKPKAKEDEDLGLPASILGDAPAVKAEKKEDELTTS